MESCLKMLGVTDNNNLFSLRNKEGPLTEFSVDQQIGDLLSSEKRLLELHLWKKEEPEVLHPKVNVSQGVSNDNLQGNIRTKEEKIRELNQHVDSLQNVIHQVQELHHSLVFFCGELRNMEKQQPPKAVCLSAVETQLGLAQGRLHEKQQSVRAMQGRLSNLEADKNRRLEVHLLEKMKLDCQIFKEEIIVIHLNRQVARLKSALQEFQAKEHTQMRSSTLGQLVSPQCPAMLLAAHELQNGEGRYGFTVRFTEDAGLVVVHVENSQLYLNDRLVEVNGVSVLESGEDELSDLLFRQPSAQIVVLRKPPPLPPKPGRVPESVRHPPPAATLHCQVTT
ncbi:hypothetical protein AAFF_G00117050 [Aldrovandia affinis]|uniref:PDZ domain-containing protein n=1 Tax=Aldrovandia affinis TaxID=143900 RepID=A0AAD7WYC6_9TELE|nr:hypothetical protein AAFF_G00117050 [Aldrovandia affinis]